MRMPRGQASRERTAPLLCWAQKAIALAIPASANSGISVGQWTGAGFRAEMRVLDLRDDVTSAWYDLGAWGQAPDGVPGPARDGLGVVDVDVFRSARTFDAVELRFRLRSAPDGRRPAVRRVALCVSNTTGDASAFSVSSAIARMTFRSASDSMSKSTEKK